MNIETLHIGMNVRYPQYGVEFVRLPLHRLNGANGMSDIEHVATGNRAGRRQRS